MEKYTRTTWGVQISTKTVWSCRFLWLSLSRSGRISV